MEHLKKHIREFYLVTFHRIKKKNTLPKIRYISDSLSILKSTVVD